RGRVADAGGFQPWSQSLQQGTPRWTVAFDIVHSPEAHARQVAAAYHELLGRNPDPAGLRYWVTVLDQGLTPARLLARIAGSAEYIALRAPGGLDVPPPAVISPPDIVSSPFIGPPVFFSPPVFIPPPVVVITPPVDPFFDDSFFDAPFWDDFGGDCCDF